MNQEQYIAPELEIIAFDTEDVITTSVLSDGGENGIPDNVDYGDLF